MNLDQTLSKIKKCLALAKSSNPHEAAAAMRQAQKLMAEHNVTETDVSLAESFAGTERDQLLIEQYMAGRYPDLKRATVKDRAKGRNISHNDIAQGLASGKQAQLNRGVGGAAQQGLLT